MKITYIGHSGFLAELEKVQLLFDYYEGELPQLSGEKPLLVFASHRHPDHFNPVIFKLARERDQVTYVLSNDIWKGRIPEEVRGRTVRLKSGERRSLESLNIRVQTLRSTDEGVAFLVYAEGKTLYHGGDLNNWRWEGEEEGWNRQMEEHFCQYLEPLRGVHLDAAFLPLDPRQEKNYALGMDYFLSLADLGAAGGPERIYPMHCWEDYSIIERWLLEHPEHPFREKIVRITGRNEAFYQ